MLKEHPLMLLSSFLHPADVLLVIGIFFRKESDCFVYVDLSSLTIGNKLFRQCVGISCVMNYHSKQVIISHQNIYYALCLGFMVSSGKENIFLS